MAGYLVTGPLAVVHVQSKLMYLYQGATVPDGVDDDEVKRLEQRGLIGKPDDEAPSDVVAPLDKPAPDDKPSTARTAAAGKSAPKSTSGS